MGVLFIYSFSFHGHNYSLGISNATHTLLTLYEASFWQIVLDIKKVSRQ